MSIARNFVNKECPAPFSACKVIFRIGLQKFFHEAESVPQKSALCLAKSSEMSRMFRFWGAGYLMENLLKHILAKLEVGKICVVFESRLEQVFPKDPAIPEKRKEAIMAFAKKNGLSAKISDPGLRVTFSKSTAG
jgi:hypothetical protein